MTKGRSGKLVASWSLAWNSSMVSVEFCGDSPGSAPLAMAPRLPCTPQKDSLLFLPHFCSSASSATLKGKPRSRENHARGKTMLKALLAMPAPGTQPCTVLCRSQEMPEKQPPFFQDLGQSSTNRTLFFPHLAASQ